MASSAAWQKPGACTAASSLLSSLRATTAAPAVKVTTLADEARAHKSHADVLLDACVFQVIMPHAASMQRARAGDGTRACTQMH